MDLDGLHQKIERKTAIERENMQLFEQFQGKLFTHFTCLASQISKYQDSCSEVVSKLRQEGVATLEARERVLPNFLMIGRAAAR